MSDVIRAVVLGVVEGLTEFLPVSSTGHMILAMPLLGVAPEQPPWPAFLYFIQIGAIVAVISYFGRRLVSRVFRRPTGGLGSHLVTKLVVATAPAAVIGILLNDWVEAHLERPVPVAAALVAGAGVMEWIERRGRAVAGATLDSITLRQALLIGLAQCFSIIPGTSRAMATIMGGILVGLPAAVAAEFSFYLAIPTLLGAGTLKVVKHAADLNGPQASLLAIGFAAALVTALAVVSAFMRFVQTRRLRPFAIYRVILGIVVLTWWWCRGAGI